jgi:hypothetical protein
MDSKIAYIGTGKYPYQNSGHLWTLSDDGNYRMKGCARILSKEDILHDLMGGFLTPYVSKKKLYEILVPASNNKQGKFTYAHHKKWDAFVMEISKGVTIMKTGKGEWVSPEGELYKDRVIPCRIACTAEEIDKIIDFTITHYNQLAVMAYCISEEVIIKHAKTNDTH